MQKEQVTHWETLNYSKTLPQAELLNKLIDEAEAIVVGIGAGMSAATGFTYVGERFTKNFPDFIKKYNFFDMLQASLFEFEDLSEYWAFQSRVSLLNFFDQPVGKSYVDLREKLNQKNYHIITSKNDNAFYAVDVEMNMVLRIQGEYGLCQCVNHCHQQMYSNDALMRQIVTEQKDMNIPTHLMPYFTNYGAG